MKQRIFTLITSLLLLWPLAARTQDALLVRSAEHPEYSRLLVTVPSGTTWAIVREGRKATVSFPGVRSKFALEQIFERMPRTRIVAVEGRNAVIGSALDLTLACSCEIEVSRVGSRFVAVDVKRAASTQSASTGRRVLTPRVFGEQSAKPEVPDELADSPAPPEAETLPEVTPEPVVVAEGSQLSGETISPNATVSSRNPSVEAARNALVEQLNRAAAEGLIELTESPEQPSFNPTLPSIMAENLDKEPALPAVAEVRTTDEASEQRVATMDAPAPMKEPEAVRYVAQLPKVKAPNDVIDGPAPSGTRDPMAQLSMAGPLLDAQIEASTPLDDLAAANERNSETNICPRNAGLDVRRWGSQEPIAESIGQYRREMISNYGTVDEAIVAKLAKFYISIGFGREAEHIVTLVHTTESDDMRLLTDLARVIEGRAATPGGYLDSMDACIGRLSMWRVVAGFERLDPGTERSDKVVEAFGELPVGLRRMAGEEIIRHALQADGAEHAEIITRILDRTPGEMSARENVARARLTAELGAPSEAAAQVAAIEPDALLEVDRLQIHLLQAEDVIQKGARVPEEMILDLESLKRHYRGKPQETDIDLALARLEFLSKRPETGFARLRGIAEANQVQGETLREIGQQGLKALDATTMPETEYVAMILENSAVLDGRKDGVALRNALARDLMKRGLPNAALDLLEAIPVLPRRDDRILRAEALLQSDLPAEVLRVLDGLEGEDVARFRSEAFIRLGSIENAYEALGSLPDGDPDRNTLAFLSRNYTDIAAEGLDGALQPLTSELARDGGQVESSPALNDEDATTTAAPSGETIPDSPPEKPLSLAELEAQLQGAADLRSAFTNAEDAIASND